MPGPQFLHLHSGANNTGHLTGVAGYAGEVLSLCLTCHKHLANVININTNTNTNINININEW